MPCASVSHCAARTLFLLLVCLSVHLTVPPCCTLCFLSALALGSLSFFECVTHTCTHSHTQSERENPRAWLPLCESLAFIPMRSQHPASLPCAGLCVRVCARACMCVCDSVPLPPPSSPFSVCLQGINEICPGLQREGRERSGVCPHPVLTAPHFPSLSWALRLHSCPLSPSLGGTLWVSPPLYP